MHKIKKISIINYRAFFNSPDGNNDYVINLPEGNNLLIYGENGSGKSSLYKALNDIYSSATEDIEFINNIFTEGQSGLPEANIVLEFTNSTSYEFNRLNSTAFGQNIFINSIKGFFSYKNLIKTYLIEHQNPNLYDIFINDLLGRLIDAALIEDFKSKIIQFERYVSNFENNLLNALSAIDSEDPTKTVGQTHEVDQVREDLEGLLLNETFVVNRQITDLMQSALIIVNNYLKEYFKFDMEIKLANVDNFLTPFHNKTEHKLIKELQFVVNYNGHDRNYLPYTSFLNEARLSAFAICLYFAAIKKEEELAGSFEQKILFLDDIFIGLDSSNRLPLLEIIKREFSDFQIFITTYDRYWYETAGKILGEDWRKTEMYAGKSQIMHLSESRTENIKYFDKPVLITTDLEIFQKAKKYFHTFDYYSAGNNLRDAAEQYIRDIIPITYCYDIKDLNSALNILEKFYKDCECSDLLNVDLVASLKLFKDLIFNPASHFDLRHPLYRAEIEKGIEIVEKLYALPKITRKFLLGFKSQLVFQTDIPHSYKATYIILENIYGVIIPNQANRITDPLHEIIEYIDNGVRGAGRGKFIKLSKRPAKIQHSLNLGESPSWISDFKTTSGKSLTDLLREAEVSH